MKERKRAAQVGTNFDHVFDANRKLEKGKAEPKPVNPHRATRQLERRIPKSSVWKRGQRR